MTLIREHIDFERGMDPKKAMSIGFFKFEVEYKGGFVENFKEDELFAREWNYNGERILEAEGSAGSDHISMWIKLSDGKEFSVEANFTREKSAYLTIPSEDIKDKNVSKEFFEFFNDEDSNFNYSPLNPVLSVYELYFKEIEDEKEMQRIWDEENEEEELDEAQEFQRGINPRASMKIGMPTWETLQEEDVIYVPKRIGIRNDNIISELHAVADFPAGSILTVRELDNASTKEWTLRYFYFWNMKDFKEHRNEDLKDKMGYVTGTPKQFKENFKLLSRGMNEAQEFQRGEDPKKTMKIGKRNMIEQWLKEMLIDDVCSINNDLTIDSSSLVRLGGNKTMGDLPEYIQFNIVRGGFNIEDNNFTTLRGCPKKILSTDKFKGNFKCGMNQLTSLEYSPKIVEGNYLCNSNPGQFKRADVTKVCKVKSGKIWADTPTGYVMPVKEGMDFQRTEDPMGTMDIGFHAQVKTWFKSCGISDDENNEHYIEYRVNRDGTIDVLDDINLVGAHIANFPYFIRFNKIHGSFYVAQNIFTNLDGFPKEVQGDLSIYSSEPKAKKWKESEIRKKIKVKGTIWN